MKEELKVSVTFKAVTLILIITGAVTFVTGLLSKPEITWAAYLIANYYFLSLAIGGAFFFGIQSISQAGWAAAFQRIPEAMMAYIPFGALSLAAIYFGLHYLYPWSLPEAAVNDPLIQHKSAYLNVPFFMTRLIICFASWIILMRIIRKISLQQDMCDPENQSGIMTLFARSELYSKIFIFILAVTFSLSAIDLIMSIEVHWYSTIFALKNLVAAFLHGVSVLALIVFILFKRGYFPFLNKYHLHDFARYIFMFCIIWGYFWFAQFMIIWYGNIPAETTYFYIRWHEGWKIMFFLEIILNWGVPFMILLPVKTSRNMNVITGVIIVLIIGQYIDLFDQIIPGTTRVLSFGWIEAGIFLGYAGLFSLVVAGTLASAKIIPRNHPYLEESFNHKF
jgi:hypothetical protein